MQFSIIISFSLPKYEKSCHEYSLYKAHEEKKTILIPPHPTPHKHGVVSPHSQPPEKRLSPPEEHRPTPPPPLSRPHVDRYEPRFYADDRHQQHEPSRDRHRHGGYQDHDFRPRAFDPYYDHYQRDYYNHGPSSHHDEMSSSRTHRDQLPPPSYPRPYEEPHIIPRDEFRDSRPYRDDRHGENDRRDHVPRLPPRSRSPRSSSHRRSPSPHHLSRSKERHSQEHPRESRHYTSNRGEPAEKRSRTEYPREDDTSHRQISHHERDVYIPPSRPSYRDDRYNDRHRSPHRDQRDYYSNNGPRTVRPLERRTPPPSHPPPRTPPRRSRNAFYGDIDAK